MLFQSQFFLGHELDLSVTQSAQELGIIGNAHNYVGIAVYVGKQGLHILHVHLGIGQNTQNLGQSAGSVGHFHCPDRSHGQNVTVL